MRPTPLVFKVITVAAFIFLYLPIITLIVMSFNGGRNPYVMEGVSLQWYRELLTDGELIAALEQTLIVAAVSSLIAVVVGTALAVGLARTTRSRSLEIVSVIPAVIPDVVQGIGLAAMFTLLAVPLGLTTVIAGHTVFATAFVVSAVRARLATSDPSLEEASRDLGAGTFTTYLRVTTPIMAPAIVAGGLLAFTLSLDEYVIASFTSGSTSATLPILVYSRVRFNLTPEINALGTVLIVVSLVALVIGARWIGRRGKVSA